MQTRHWIVALTFTALFSMLVLTSPAYLAPLTTASTLSPPAAPQGGGTGVAQWECWDDGTLDPCHPDFYGVDGLAPNDVWAVGESGSIFRYNGTTWNRVAFENDITPFYDVDVIANDSVWAVSSALWHWDGTIWEEVASSSRASIALSMVSDTDGWAVGYDGDIRHWNGTDFITVTSPITTPLRDIQMLSATDGWAVGDNGVIVRYNGSAWVAYPSPTTLILTKVQMRSATEGYAIGNNIFLRWNGTSWTIAANPPDFFTSLAMVSSGEGYADGFQGIYHWDGIEWTLDYTGTASYLNDMMVFPDEQIFAVGTESTILQRDSGGWNPVNGPQPHELAAVAALSPTNIWAVGYEETLMHYDGVTWQAETFTSLPTDINNRAFYAITFLNDTDGWIVGSDLMIRWNGSSWQEVDNGTEEYQSYRGVAAVSSNDVWVVGELSGGSGSVIRHWNGTTWSDIPHPALPRLNTITMLDSDTGMAGGYRYDSTMGIYESVLLRWNGSIWSEVTTPNISEVSSIVLEDTDNGWVISNGGGLRLENGVFTLNTNIYGYSAAFSNPYSGWIVGTYGHRWDGTTWHYDQYFPQYATDALLFEDGTGWGVGTNGVIYRFDPPLTTYMPLIQRGD